MSATKHSQQSKLHSQKRNMKQCFDLNEPTEL